VLGRPLELGEPAQDVAALLVARVVNFEQDRPVPLDDRWSIRRHAA